MDFPTHISDISENKDVRDEALYGVGHGSFCTCKMNINLTAPVWPPQSVLG